MDAVIEEVYNHQINIGVIFLTDLPENMFRLLLDSCDLEFHEAAASMLSQTDALTAARGLSAENFISQAAVAVPLTVTHSIPIG